MSIKTLFRPPIVAMLARIGVIVSVSLIVFAVIASQVIMFMSINEASDAHENERKDRIQVEEQIDALRQRATNAEEAVAEINCVQFERINDFITAIARINADNPNLTPAQRAEIEPFLTPLPVPAACR